MPDFDQARPRYSFPFAGKDYDLVGDLAMVEAIEGSLKEGIIQITTRSMDMGVTDAAKLVSAMLTCAGFRTPPHEVGKVIMDAGINSDVFLSLKMHAYAFLRVMLEPPELREAMAEKMGEFLGSLKLASPGDSTKSSA